MKKSYFFKFFVFALVGALVILPSCKDYDDDISGLETELSTLKSTVLTEAELNNVKTQLESSINQTKTELAAVKAKADASLSKAELDAAMALVVKLETYNAYKAIVDADLAKLKADVAKAATKEEVDAIKATLESSINQVRDEYGARLANLEALLKVNDGKSEVLDQIHLDLTEQLAMIEANATEIAAVNEELQAKYVELKALIEANKNDIEVLDSKVEAYKSELDAKIANLKLELTAMIVDVYQSLDHRVYTLTFIPDFTSADGTPQIVVRGLTEWKFYKPANNTHSDIWTVPGWNPNWDENWAVLKKGVIYKGVTTLRYNVSPSNVQLTDFEVKQLVNKTSLVRAAGTVSAPIVLSGQATLANGVLSVPVVIEANNYNSADFSSTNNPLTNVSVALQVENINVAMDNNEERIVTSTEYIKANFDLSHGRIALNEKSLKTNGTLLPVGIEYNAIADASYTSDISLWNGKSQSGNTTDVLNHTINLNDYIYGRFDNNFNQLVKMNEFGFNAHTFKFRRVYLQSEGVNQSNDYVTLNETTGVIGVVPANGHVNAAAVGRTPIVEVTALVNGKVHAVGYIKIHITDSFDDSDIIFEFTLEDYVLGCDSEYKLTNVDIDAIDFDQIFNDPRIQLGKDAFFAEYNQIPMVVTKVSPTPSAATVGNLEDGTHVEFGYSINPATQSVNLFNYIQAYITNDAPVGDYEVKTRLKSNGYRPDVVITWNFKVVLPTDISLIPNSIYYKNGGIVVNPTIFEQGALSSTAYEALLNNTFVHESGNFDYEGLTQTCQDYLTPYFVFTEVPAGFTISTDKKSIWKGGLKAAEIVQVGDEFFVRLNNIGSNPPSGPWGNNTPFSDAAKQLVGKTVKIQPRAYINSQPLNDISLYDPFTVMFRKPLTLQFPDNAVVYDQANDGVKNVYTINLYSPTVIKDWNGKLISVLTNEGRSLIEHYEIDFTMEWHPGIWWNPSTWELGSPFKLGKPQVNLQVDGTIGGAYRDIPMGTGMKIDIDYEEGEIYTHPHYGSMNTPATITFEWSNSSTGEVQNEFMVRIPITVKHKWSPADEPLMDYLYITVKPGNGQP